MGRKTGKQLDSNSLGKSTRRNLVKKAGYSAPVLVFLGAAGLSGRARAQFNGPPSAPATNSNNQLDEAEERLLLESQESERE